MLRTFTAALLATALIAGPALAAQPSGATATTPTASAPATAAPAPAAAKQTNEAKPAKMVNHVRNHARHRVAHVAKPGKIAKNTKSSA